jgi:Uridine phosphorylase
MEKIKESELVLQPNGNIYHLNLSPENLAHNIIVVGDPGRVPVVSKYFDKIEFQTHNREMHTHTGIFNNKRITVLSTGMGTDNLDIVINELDALVNIDLKERTIKEKHTSLNIVRLGTSGALQADIPVDSLVMSTHGLGLDGLLNFYKDENGIIDKVLTEAFIRQTGWDPNLAKPYVVKCSETLENKMGDGLLKGITATASGFYGPQGRELRLKLAHPDMNEKIENFEFNGHKIVNFEMETSALYGLSALLGHHALTICAIIANRVIKQFSNDHEKIIENLIQLVLQRLTK